MYTYIAKRSKSAATGTFYKQQLQLSQLLLRVDDLIRMHLCHTKLHSNLGTFDMPLVWHPW